MILNVLAVCTIVVRALHVGYGRGLQASGYGLRASGSFTGQCSRSTHGPKRQSIICERYSTSVKILVADDLPASALDLLRAEGWAIDARTGRTPDELSTDIADADAIGVRSATKVTAPIINAARNLRVIARAGTGVDNVDVPAASARGIVVMNAAGANSIRVSELAIGLT